MPAKPTGLIGTLTLLLLTTAVAAWGAEGEIVYAEGPVQVRRAQGSEEAFIGMPVGQGDVIETGRGAMAIITIDGDVDIKLREQTRLALDSLDDSIAVNLEQGSAFSRIARRLNRTYRLETETTVAGVRGTEFFVAYGRMGDQGRDVWLCVNEGSVEVQIAGKEQTLTVNEGEGINIVDGLKLTKPRRYPWTRRLNWNTSPDVGIVADDTDLSQAYADLLDQDYD